ncbi:MAG: hemerythrin domain-containing protein [Ignavibacteriales bacterium]|nr:MAG: hemerythrin domain-containing protein [Ignavibacteriales bacterium]
MKRHGNLIALSHDHHHGLVLANLIKINAPVYKGLPNDLPGKIEYTKNFFNTELIRHFNDEEEILYPLVKGKSKEIDILFTEIFFEHIQIKKLVEQLDSSSDQITILDKLGRLLENHIRKEERELFVMIENEINESELNKLVFK